MGLEWQYSQDIHRQDTIVELAQRFVTALQEIIDHCLSTETGGHTPSDFDLADLGNEEFGHLADLLDTLDSAEDY